MEIQVLGPSCANCLKLEMLVMEALGELGLRKARVEKNHDSARNGTPDDGRSARARDRRAPRLVRWKRTADEGANRRMDSRGGNDPSVRMESEFS